MKITNNSGKLIILLNDKKIKKYSTVDVRNSEVNNSLEEQLENLQKLGLITVEP